MNFTDNALKQFKKLLDENEKPKSGIRFFTAQGCCSPTLQMNIADNPNQGDKVMQIDDVDVFITSEAEEILSEITIDYSEDTFRTVKATNDNPTKKCC